jgi:hypothetical protein
MSASNPVEIGKPLEITDLQDYVDNYLMKAEPNLYIDKPLSNITIDKQSDKINITEIIKRPSGEIVLDKQMNTTLTLNDFKVTISSLDKSNEEVLIFGKYQDRTLEDPIKVINDLIVSEPEKYQNMIFNYLINYDKTGNNFEIIPIKNLESYINNADDKITKENKNIIIDNIKIILSSFIKEHNKYLKLEPTDLKYKLYVYKLTSPYNTYSLRTLGFVEKRQIGMQTEGAHMDECTLNSSNYIDDEYCQLSSIIYTNVKNNKSKKPNYFASASFFYGSEIPMPINISKTTIYNKDSILQKFQKNYKRLFISAPMTSSGWAIWKNNPKRYIKNITGNRFGNTSKSGFNQIEDGKFYKYFSKDNNEFVYHSSPFDAYNNFNFDTSGNLITKTDNTCNWAPTDDCHDATIDRLNFTIRRANYNLFRFFRDLFDDNRTINIIAKAVIEYLKDLLQISDNSHADNVLVPPIIKENFKNIYNNIIKLINIQRDTKEDTTIKSNKNIAMSIYHQFKLGYIITYNNSVEIEPKSKYNNSIELLEHYLNSLFIFLNDSSKGEALLKWYDISVNKLQEQTDREQYRGLIEGYKHKYLKYKQKYLELKKYK